MIFLLRGREVTSSAAPPWSSVSSSVCVLCKFVSPPVLSFEFGASAPVRVVQSISKLSYNQHHASPRQEKPRPGASEKQSYFRKQNVASLLRPDMLSALSLMHESSGSFPFLIKKRTRCRRKECRQQELTEEAATPRVFFLPPKGSESSVCRFC